MIIGRKYEETKKQLQDLIRQGSIDFVQREDTRHCCYFCLQRIEGSVIQLNFPYSVNGEYTKEHFWVHSSCFQEETGLPFS